MQIDKLHFFCDVAGKVAISFVLIIWVSNCPEISKSRVGQPFSFSFLLLDRVRSLGRVSTMDLFRVHSLLIVLVLVLARLVPAEPAYPCPRLAS